MENCHVARLPIGVDPFRSKAGIGAEQAQPDGVHLMVTTGIVGDMFKPVAHRGASRHGREQVAEQHDVNAERSHRERHPTQQCSRSVVRRAFRHLAERRPGECRLDGPVQSHARPPLPECQPRRRRQRGQQDAGRGTRPRTKCWRERPAARRIGRRDAGPSGAGGPWRRGGGRRGEHGEDLGRREVICCINSYARFGQVRKA